MESNYKMVINLLIALDFSLQRQGLEPDALKFLGCSFLAFHKAFSDCSSIELAKTIEDVCCDDWYMVRDLVAFKAWVTRRFVEVA